MEILFKHFWLFCGLFVGGLGGWDIKRRVLKNTKTDGTAKNGANSFAKGWAAAFMVPTTVLWLLQISAGSDLGHDFTSWPTPRNWIAIGVMIMCWGALLSWMFLGSSGAKMLSRMMITGYPRYPKPLLSPLAFRIYSIAGVISGVSALYVSLGAN